MPVYITHKPTTLATTQARRTLSNCLQNTEVWINVHNWYCSKVSSHAVVTVSMSWRYIPIVLICHHLSPTSTNTNIWWKTTTMFLDGSIFISLCCNSLPASVSKTPKITLILVTIKTCNFWWLFFQMDDKVNLLIFSITPSYHILLSCTQSYLYIPCSNRLNYQTDWFQSQQFSQALHFSFFQNGPTQFSPT